MHLQAASSGLRYFLRTLWEALRCASRLASKQASETGYMIWQLLRRNLRKSFMQKKTCTRPESRTEELKRLAPTNLRHFLTSRRLIDYAQTTEHLLRVCPRYTMQIKSMAALLLKHMKQQVEKVPLGPPPCHQRNIPRVLNKLLCEKELDKRLQIVFKYSRFCFIAIFLIIIINAFSLLSLPPPPLS